MRLAAVLSTMLAAGVASTVLVGPVVAAQPRDADGTGRYIVVLDATSRVDDVLAELRRTLDVRPTRAYRSAVRGFAATLTGTQVAALRRDPAVKVVAPDRPVTLGAQTLPAGTDRVEADRSPTARIDGVDTALDADIAVIDTGVDRDHPDLNVAGGVDCVDGTPDGWDDVHGHGTHVAGIAAARDNGVGVVGVAPGARIWSLRVFDETGNAYSSAIVCAIEWVVAHRDPSDPTRPLIEVANMSFTGPGWDDLECGASAYDAQHDAICASVAAGTVYVAAAGNDSLDAADSVPAAYDEVITVSALTDYNGRAGGGGAATCGSSRDLDDTFADFSNFGEDVDLVAPGTCILSTVRGGAYGRMSGTSMAAPAVAGAAGLYRATHPAATPAEVRDALRAAGSLDWATGSDPDPAHERLLDVSSFGASPGFAVTSTTASATVPEAGGAARYGVELVRRNGFAGPVELTVTGVPAGATAAFTVGTSADRSELSSDLTISVPAGAAAGAYPLTVTGRSGSITSTASVRLVKQPWDTTAPAVRAPTAELVTGSTLGTGAVPVQIRWSATDASGVARYELQQSTDAGAWTSVALPSNGTTSISRPTSPGHSYRFRVRATDTAGNASAWVTGATATVAAYQETSGGLVYAGTWTRQASSAAYGGYQRYATAAGATARLSFTGRTVAWVAPRSSSRGQAYIAVDGVRVATVDLAASAASSRRIVFSRAWSSSATHRIEVRVVGTSGRPRVDIDAFVVIR